VDNSWHSRLSLSPPRKQSDEREIAIGSTGPRSRSIAKSGLQTSSLAADPVIARPATPPRRRSPPACAFSPRSPPSPPATTPRRISPLVPPIDASPPPSSPTRPTVRAPPLSARSPQTVPSYPHLQLPEDPAAIVLAASVASTSFCTEHRHVPPELPPRPPTPPRLPARTIETAATSAPGHERSPSPAVTPAEESPLSVGLQLPVLTNPLHADRRSPPTPLAARLPERERGRGDGDTAITRPTVSSPMVELSCGPGDAAEAAPRDDLPERAGALSPPDAPTPPILSTLRRQREQMQHTPPPLFTVGDGSERDDVAPEGSRDDSPSDSAEDLRAALPSRPPPSYPLAIAPALLPASYAAMPPPASPAHPAGSSGALPPPPSVGFGRTRAEQPRAAPTSAGFPRLQAGPTGTAGTAAASSRLPPAVTRRAPPGAAITARQQLGARVGGWRARPRRCVLMPPALAPTGSAISRRAVHSTPLPEVRQAACVRSAEEGDGAAAPQPSPPSALAPPPSPAGSTGSAAPPTNSEIGWCSHPFERAHLHCGISRSLLFIFYLSLACHRLCGGGGVGCVWVRRYCTVDAAPADHRVGR